jgi:hypothetical protein
MKRGFIGQSFFRLSGRYLENARQVFLDALAIAEGGRAACRAVVTVDGGKPALAGPILFAQDIGGDSQVLPGIEQIAGTLVAMPLMAQVDLGQTDIHALEGMRAQAFGQFPASIHAVLETVGTACHVQCPRPGREPALAPDAAFLQGDGVEHGGGNPGLSGGEPVVRGNLLDGGHAGTGEQEAGKKQQEARKTGHCRCHLPFTCRRTAGKSPGNPNACQRPAS